MDHDSLETLLQHAHRIDEHDPNVVPPIYQASTFAFEEADAMAQAASTPRHEGFYTRYGNPNQGDAARVIAAIEGAEAALLTASGMGAISALSLALLNAGDHVVAQRIIYPGTRSLLNDTLARFGVETTYVDQHDTQAFAAAMTPKTKLVMLETPSNPGLGITDVSAVAAIAHARGALVSVDNTIATPVNQRPLDLGADLVIHSATKYLGGHSDLLAGAIAGARELVDRIWKTHTTIGAVLGPIDAWLLLRGLRTLDLRVRQHNATAQAVAEHLERHARVERVFYPGLATHPQHALASQQMRGFGGLLSFEVRASFEQTRDVVRRFRLIRNAVSLGGVESLAAHAAAMWPGAGESEEARAQGITPSLVRLSVGLENAGDLIADLDRALA